MGSALHHRVLGAGPPTVLVHGFTQTSACWGPLSDRWLGHRQLVLVDAPGHGGSSDVEATLWQAGALIGEVGGEADYLGYSMGGRMLLHLALDRPDLVRRLVLVGAHPGIDDPRERAQRRDADETLARRIEQIGVDAFIDEWLARPMFAGVPFDPSCSAARRSNAVHGLASSLRSCGTGSQDPLSGRLGELAMPVLLVAGALDEKFTTIAGKMAERIGVNASALTIDEAGHAAHLERPDAFSDTVLDWLGDAPPTTQ
jgi:2-succinyl-6-hydroxy-2,4-cyclohexadiene-1-carboxylate synthase